MRAGCPAAGIYGSEMKLFYRVQKLERLDAMTHPAAPLERLHCALNSSAVDSFIHSLSDADLAGLTIELERIAFGGETGAGDTTKQDWLAAMEAVDDENDDPAAPET